MGTYGINFTKIHVPESEYTGENHQLSDYCTRQAATLKKAFAIANSENIPADCNGLAWSICVNGDTVADDCRFSPSPEENLYGAGFENGKKITVYNVGHIQTYQLVDGAIIFQQGINTNIIAPSVAVATIARIVRDYPEAEITITNGDDITAIDRDYVSNYSDLMSIPEFVQLKKCSRQTIYRQIENGTLESINISGKIFLYKSAKNYNWNPGNNNGRPKSKPSK